MTQTLVKKAFFQERGLHDALAGRNVNYATAKHTLATPSMIFPTITFFLSQTI